MSAGDIFELVLMGAWYAFLIFCGLAILGIVLKGYASSLSVTKKWVEKLGASPLVENILIAVVFVLILPFGLVFTFLAMFSSNGREIKSSEQKRKTRKNPSRPVSGSIVADAMLFDGDPEKARRARTFRNLFD